MYNKIKLVVDPGESNIAQITISQINNYEINGKKCCISNITLFYHLTLYYYV